MNELEYYIVKIGCICIMVGVILAVIGFLIDFIRS